MDRIEHPQDYIFPKKTGIDFFPSLNDNLENALEATYSTKAWPGLE